MLNFRKLSNLFVKLFCDETNARLLVKEGIGHIPIIDLQLENFRSIVETALNMVTLG